MATGTGDKKNNILNTWGNEKTMNLNNMILTNILSSHYFKVNLYQLKTFHEVVDEIYYNVSHLEPWEKGSRKTSGQTGMCGGVRGVGAGGIVSTAFCILYKLFTLKLTRKQVMGLITHCDSPYIRGLGFMYIRYTQPPADLWDWFESFLTDEEELDVKAGGGQVMTIGEMLRHFLSKLEWHSTLFPRTPVPIQKDIERRLSAFLPPPKPPAATALEGESNEQEEPEEEDASAQQNNAAWPQQEEKRGREDPTRSSRKEASSNGKFSRDRQDVSQDIVKERDRQQLRHGNSNATTTATGRSGHRSKERDRNIDREKDRDREKERDRDRNSDREKERDKNKIVERERKVDREKDREKPRNRDRSSSRERHHRSSENRHQDHHSRNKHKLSNSKRRSHSRDRSRHRRH